jgi:hypothetical protein
MPPELVRFVADSDEFFEDLFGRKTVSDGETAAHEETTLVLTGYTATKQFGTEIVVELLISVGEKVIEGAIAEWLWEKIRRSTKHIKYGGMTYDVTISGITRLLKRLKLEQRLHQLR